MIAHRPTPSSNPQNRQPSFHPTPLQNTLFLISKHSSIIFLKPRIDIDKPTYLYPLLCRPTHLHSVWPEKRDRNSQELSLPKKSDGCSREQTCQTEPRTRKGNSNQTICVRQDHQRVCHRQERHQDCRQVCWEWW